MSPATEVCSSTEMYLAAYDKVAGMWGQSLRSEAIGHFKARGFPSPREESWRFTNTATLERTEFHLAGCEMDHSAASAALDRLSFDLGSARLIFVDGRFVPTLSAAPSELGGVTACSLAEASSKQPELVNAHLGKYATNTESHPFLALNQALMTDGAFIHVPRGTVVDRPIHLLFLSTGGGQQSMTHVRNLILAEESSQVTLLESYGAIDDGVYFTNAATEVVVRANAHVDHYKLNRESESAYHASTLVAGQGRDSTYRNHLVSIGGKLSRYDSRTLLGGEGLTSTLNGLYIGRGTQHVDNHTCLEHIQPNTDSRELYKGILDDQSTAVFVGNILVHQEAQKTNAVQSNKNLLLSKEAVANSQPQLEIFADDVKCTHGSTTGQLCQESMFYLRSRAVPEAYARGLLIYAFANEMIEQIKIDPLRDQLEQLIYKRFGYVD